MNKNVPGKKFEYTKSLVRNPVLTKPKTVVFQQQKQTDPGPAFQKPTSESDDEFNNDKTKFNSPELNSALRIVRKMELVETIQPRKVKSISDLDRKKKAVVIEKSTKQVNFPYNQPIYKDLIPLSTRVQQPPLPQRFSIPREVMARDKEPVLSDFFTPIVFPEYRYEVPQQTSQKTLIKQFDGLKLYRTIKNWN